MDDYLEELLDQFDIWVEFPLESEELIESEDYWDQDPGVSLEL